MPSRIAVHGKKGGYGRFMLPVPYVLAALVLALLAIDVLDTVTSGYGWISDTEQLFGWNLPPLLATARALSGSLVLWLGTPISFVLRLDREFPLDMQRQVMCHGTPERHILMRVMAAALGHAVCIWSVCFLVSSCLTSLICTGTYEPSLVVQISGARDIAVDHPLISNVISCSMTAAPALLATFIAAALYEAMGSPAFALTLVPMLYLVHHYVFGALGALSPVLAVPISFLEIILTPLFSAYPGGFESLVSMIPTVAWISWWLILDCAIIWTALQGRDWALVRRCA